MTACEKPLGGPSSGGFTRSTLTGYPPAALPAKGSAHEYMTVSVASRWPAYRAGITPRADT
jgi:hypothetical protein